MKKFTKISAAALFALFLTACDKPAEKAPETKAETSATTETTQAQPAEQAKAAEQAANTQPAVQQLNAEELADYNKVVDWNKIQQPLQVAAQEKLQLELNDAVQEKNNQKVIAALNDFGQYIQTTIKSLDSLEVKSDVIKTLKTKIKEVLQLSADLLIDQAKLTGIEKPNEDEVKAYQEKANVLQATLADLQKLSAELEQRVPVVPLSDEEKADYAKFVEWNKVQEPIQTAAQEKLNQDLNAAKEAKDSKKVVAAIDNFNNSVKEIIKSLDGVEVKSALVKELKDKTKNVLTLSSALLVEQSKLATIEKPSEEALKSYQAKSNVLQNALLELQSLSNELDTRATQK